MSLVDGHAGVEVRYIAASREVLMSSWMMRKKKKWFRTKMEKQTHEERLPIPAEISTEEELRAYVREQEPFWLRD